MMGDGKTGWREIQRSPAPSAACVGTIGAKEFQAMIVSHLGQAFICARGPKAEMGFDLYELCLSLSLN